MGFDTASPDAFKAAAGGAPHDYSAPNYRVATHGAIPDADSDREDADWGDYLQVAQAFRPSSRARLQHTAR